MPAEPSRVARCQRICLTLLLLLAFLCFHSLAARLKTRSLPTPFNCFSWVWPDCGCDPAPVPHPGPPPRRRLAEGRRVATGDPGPRTVRGWPRVALPRTLPPTPRPAAARVWMRRRCSPPLTSLASISSLRRSAAGMREMRVVCCLSAAGSLYCAESNKVDRARLDAQPTSIARPQSSSSRPPSQQR